MFRFLS